MSLPLPSFELEPIESVDCLVDDDDDVDDEAKAGTELEPSWVGADEDEDLFSSIDDEIPDGIGEDDREAVKELKVEAANLSGLDASLRSLG